MFLVLSPAEYDSLKVVEMTIIIIIIIIIIFTEDITKLTLS